VARQVEEDAEEGLEIRIRPQLEAIQSLPEEPEATLLLDAAGEPEPVRAEPQEPARPAAGLPEVDAEVRAAVADPRSGIRRWRTSRAIRR
jgi:hypothetical protein